jgi:hypothetical protein
MYGAGGYLRTGEEGVGGSQHTSQNPAAQKRLQQVQAEVDEVRVCGILRVNAEKALERDGKLSESDNRSAGRTSR